MTDGRAYGNEERREGKMIYTRSYGKGSGNGARYSPPPGYDGNAFPPTPEVKLHEAEDDVRLLRRKREPAPEIPREQPEPEENNDLFEDSVPFTENGTVTGTENAESARPQNPPEPDFGAEPGKLPSAENIPVFAGGTDALEALLRHLKEKFGREELILVLVMLLVSSEGASPELLLLALLLIAG